MNDLATLGIAVDTSPAVKAATDLERMAVSAERAEDAITDLGEKSATALKEVAKGASALPAALKDVEDSATGAGKAANGMVSPALINQMKAFESSLKSGASSTAELEIQRSQLRSLQKASMIDDAEAIKINKQLDKTQQDLAKSAVQQEKAVDQLMRSVDPTAAKMAKLERETEELGKLFDKGTISAKDYATALGKIDESAAKIGAANDPIIKTTGALGELGLGSRRAREDVVQLGKALASGDWAGAGRNIAQIGVEAGAMAGRLLLVAAPIALVVAGLGALAYGYSKGSQEGNEYNKSLVLTGNYAGVSAGQLGDLAKQVSATVGTTAAAADVLATLAGNGKIAGESFASITEAAIGMREGTGKAVSDTVAEFVKLADEPVKASAALNDQYHYLTASVYSQIAALEEQGNHAGAVKLATESFADAINDRTPKILENLSFWEKGYNAVARAADSLKNLGRRDIDSEIEEAQRKLTRAQSGDIGLFQNKQTMIDFYDNKLNMLRDEKAANADIAKYEGEQAKSQEAAITAMGKVDTLTKSAWTNEQKRNDALKEYRRQLDDIRKVAPQDPRLNQATIDQNIENIKSKFKDPKTAAVAVDLTAFNDAKNRIVAITAEYANMEKELDASHKAGIYSDQSYYEQKSAILQQQQVEVDAAYKAEISALEAAKAKKGTTAAQGIQLDQKIADARTQMVKAQQTAESQLSVLATSEQGRLTKQALAVKVYTDALDAQLTALQQQGLRNAASVGMGASQKAIYDQISSLTDKLNEQRRQLADQYGDGARNMSLEEYSQKLKALAANHQAMTDQVVSNYKQMQDAQGNWIGGATSAWQDYLDSAANVAGQTKSLLTGAFSGMEDLLVGFAVRGKASFKDFANSVIADIARIIIRTSVLGPILGGLFGGAAGGFSGIGGGQGGSGFGVGDILSYGKSAYSLANSGFGQALSSGWGSGDGFLSSLQNAASSGYGYISSMLGSGGGAAGSAVSSGLSQGATGFGSQFTAGSGVVSFPGAASATPNSALGGAGTSALGAGLAGVGGALYGYGQSGLKGAATGAAGAVGGYYAGAALGSLAGPLGTIIGGALGSALGGMVGGSLFGGDWVTKNSGIQLGVTGGALDGAQFQDQSKKGGLFGSNKKRTRLSALDPEMQTALDKTYDATEGAIFDLFGALNVKLNDGVLDGLNIASTKISTEGKTAEQIQEDITKWFAALADTMTVAVAVASDSGLGGYTFEGLQVFVANLVGVNDVLKHVNVGLFDMSVTGGFAAEQLSAMAGGFDALKTSVATYYDNFFTDTEKANNVLSDVAAEFKKLDIQLPDTRQGYRDMVEGIDKTTESGRQMFATLTALSGDAAASYTILEQRASAANQALADTLNGAVTSAMSAVQRAVSAQQKSLTEAYNAQNASLSDMASTAQANVSAMTAVSNSLKGALKSLLGTSDEAVKMLRSQAQATLQSALATARAGGSLAGFAGLDDALSAVTSNNTDLYSSLEDFNRDQGRTANVVAELNAISGNQLTAQEQLLQTVQDQIKQAKAQYDEEMSKLDKQLEFAQSQLDALNGIDNSVISVAAAMAGLSGAIAAAMAARPESSGAGSSGGIEAAYRAALGRDADPAGLAYWSGQLQSGAVSAGDLAGAITKDAKSNGEIPGFATGGDHLGGWRIVGENGPELEATGPSRIFNANQTAQMLKGGGGDSSLGQKVDVLIDVVKQIVGPMKLNSDENNRMFRKWDNVGIPVTNPAGSASK